MCSPRSRRRRSASSSTGRSRRPHLARSPSAWRSRGSISSPRSSVPRRPRDGSRSETRTSSRAHAHTRPAAQPRSPSCASRTGSVVRSTTCAPSAAAVSIPVLAKEFVVEDIQLPMLRAAGADLVLLLAVLHPPKRLARLVERALEIGLEPLVEAHDEKELRAALATDARLIGLNNRDLRTLDVDPTRADRLRALVPDDRLVIAESGVRDPSSFARWRALGFDAALVGEALMRSADPVAAVALVRQRRPGPRRSGERRAPTLRQDLRGHRRGRRAGRGPCRRRCHRAQPRARIATPAGPR